MIVFKSESQFFEKEKSNKKCNTVRELQVDEPRIIALLECKEKLLNYKDGDTITIEHATTGERFTRKITDISFWNKLVIISWEGESNG